MKRKITKIVLILLSAMLILSSCNNGETEQTADTSATEQPPSEWSYHDFSLTAVNVGYGDALIIQVDKKTFMIDTGSVESVPSVLGALNILGITSLDGLILTHTHSDHIGGVPAIAENFAIKCLYSASISENKKNGSNKIVELGQKYSLPHTRLHATDTIQITSDTYFEVLGPVEKNNDDDNDNSLVLRLYINGVTFLLTGDMQFAEEKTIINTGVSLDADVLKVANHGNKDATSKALVDLITPSVSIISTSTADRPESASDRVKQTLADSSIYITENYEYGIRLTVDENSAVGVVSLEGEKSELDLTVEGIDTDAQTVTIGNNASSEADISGVIIYSEKGGEAYVFPSGSTVGAGGTVTVVCEDTASGGEEFIWREASVWHNKKEDVAVIFDPCGNEIARS